MNDSPFEAELDDLIRSYNEGHFARAVGQARDLVSEYYELSTVYKLLAAAHLELEEFEQAADAFAGALAIEPNDATTNYNLGRALFELGRFDEAAASFDRAIALEPEYVQAHYNRGLALFRMDRMDDAAASFRRAIEIDPDHAQAHNNLGAALIKQGKLEEAAASLDRALTTGPDHAETLNNLGNAHASLGELDAAEVSFNRALALDSVLAGAHFNLGMVKLARGDFENGWRGYEWRKKVPNPSGEREFDAPLWLGDADLNGKSIFLHWEQGLGDTLHFIRYAPLARDLGARVTVAVQAVLIPLLSQALPGITLIGDGEIPEQFDFHAPLFSLPLAFKTRLETIPAPRAYLEAETARVRQWAERLGPEGFKIGVCWEGSAHNVGQGRSFPLSELSGIAKLPGIRLISLHKGDGESQLNRIPPGMTVESLGESFDPPGAAFLDTAAVIALCDLVITSDTAVAHLAGALGAPVWLVLKAVPEWRWLLDRDDSPWYPSMRLFRQERDGDWKSAFAQVERALGQLLESRQPGGASNPRPNLAQTASMPMIPASWGEVIDKITILEIKISKVDDESVRNNIKFEFDYLDEILRNHLPTKEELRSLRQELSNINNALWKIEDDIRIKEAKGEFDEEFINLARSVYRTNDLRFRIKSQINRVTSSSIIEEKIFHS